MHEPPRRSRVLALEPPSEAVEQHPLVAWDSMYDIHVRRQGISLAQHALKREETFNQSLGRQEKS